MRFNPTTKNGSEVLPDGDYDFEVIHAVDKASHAGNDMLILNLRVGSNATSRTIIDYVLASNIRKVRAVAKACGLLELFESGEILAESFIGRTGRCKLAVEKSGSGAYPDRNVVVSYAKR